MTPYAIKMHLESIKLQYNSRKFLTPKKIPKNIFSKNSFSVHEKNGRSALLNSIAVENTGLLSEAV
jgi:hypothetical protein